MVTKLIITSWRLEIANLMLHINNIIWWTRIKKLEAV